MYKMTEEQFKATSTSLTEGAYVGEITKVGDHTSSAGNESTKLAIRVGRALRNIYVGKDLTKPRNQEMIRDVLAAMGVTEAEAKAQLVDSGVDPVSWVGKKICVFVVPAPTPDGFDNIRPITPAKYTSANGQAPDLTSNGF